MSTRRKVRLSKRKEAFATNRGGFTFVGTAVKQERLASLAFRNKILASFSQLDALAKRATLRLLAEYPRLSEAASAIRILFNNIDTSKTSDRVKRDLVSHLAYLDKANATNVKASLVALTGSNVSITPSLETRAVIKTAADNALLFFDNVRDEVIDRYRKILNNAVINGVDSSAVKEAVIASGGWPESKVARAAENVSRSVTSAITNIRMQKAGVKKFRWLHSGGGKSPRDLHVGYDGEVFAFDDPPIIDPRTNTRGLPGQLINCRCRAIPVIEIEE